MAMNYDITDVKFLDDTGSSVDISKLETKIKSKVGTTLDSDNLTLDIQLLMKELPRFEHIQVSIDPGTTDEEVTLRFIFQKKRIAKIVRIIIEKGYEELNSLLDELAIRRGRVFRADALERDKEYLRKAYVRAGYPKATVDHELIEKDTNGDLEIRFHVHPKSRKVQIKKLYFYGNYSVGTDRLKDVMKTRTRSWFLASRPQLNDFTLVEDLDALYAYYKNNGYLDVKITHELELQDNKYAWISIFVEEGRRYKVRDLKVYGAKSLTPELVLKKSGLRHMKEFSEKDLRLGLQKIREYYGEVGYALVQTLSNYDPVNESLALYVQEGQVQKISGVKIEGLKKMKEKVAMYDVKIKKGDIVNTTLIKQTLQKMKATGYYRDVLVDYVPLDDPKNPNKGDLVITVTEANTQYISFGFGASTSGPQGQFSYGNQNLFGSGKGLSLQAMKSKELSKLGLVFNDPHLFGSDYTAQARASYEDRQGSEYDETRIRTRIMIKKAITEKLQFGIGARFEFVTLDNISEGINQTTYNIRKKTKVIGMISTLIYKNQVRDTAGDIKKGHSISLALLPSYSDQGAYIKAFTQVTGALSLGENSDGSSHTISGRISLGYVSDNAPVFEKYYAGGIGSIRGFESRSLTPRGNGIGGGAIVSANVAYSFPIISNRVKGVVFVEGASIGNNFESLSDVRLVGGIGVRTNLRDTFLGTSLEFGYAFPLLKQEGDQLKPFYFMFGEYDPAYDL
jgi:outer membrane protein insertion porin family